MTTATGNPEPTSSPLQAVTTSRLARLVALDDRLLRRLVRARRSPATFGLRALCRMYDPDVVMMAIAVALFGGASMVAVANAAALALIATSVLVVVVKRTVKRARPHHEVFAVAPPDRFSFPSGHTAAAFALALAMFGAVPWLAPVLILAAVAVGYARMYLGVHYPVDVAAGAALGIFTGSVVALVV